MQEAYMTVHYKYYRIALINNAPVGYIGVIDDDIRICVHPAFQKRGVGKFMIEEGMKIWPSAEGKVKLGNEASMNLFKSCGFKEAYVIFKK
jgi:GNAT superfamily N-acetyltransferase